MRLLKNLGKTGIAAIAVALATDAFAQSAGQSVGQIAGNIGTSLGGIGQAVQYAAFVAGVWFGFMAVIKFKAHGDNPRDTPLKTSIFYAVAAALAFALPTLLDSATATVWGPGTTIKRSAPPPGTSGF